MQRKAIKIVGYAAFFLVCLVFFLFQGLPVQVMADQALQKFSRDMGVRVTTGSMSTLFPNGIEATDLRVLKDASEGEAPLSLLIDSLRARISLWGLLTGKRNLSLVFKGLGGRAEGDVAIASEQISLEAEFSQLELGNLPWPAAASEGSPGGPLVTGALSGNADLVFNPKDLKTTQGNLTLNLERAQTAETNVRGLTVPPVRLGKLELGLQIDKGKAEIKVLKCKSEDLEASMDGSLQMDSKITQSVIRSRVRFKLSDEFLSKNPKFQSLIEVGGMNRAKGSDGFFSYSMNGYLSRPEFLPAAR